MKLMQIKYEFGTGKKELVVIKIGEFNQKLICILDSAVNEHEAAIIRNNMNKLYNYNLQNKVKWLRENTPIAYKKGYREIYLSRINILYQAPVPSKS
jgi:capsular polysaccharide biosynthesis protein